MSHPAEHDGRMTIVPRFEIGDVVEVYSVFGGYPLPYGLAEGTQVRIVRFEQAYRIVGREWRVYMMNITARGGGGLGATDGGWRSRQ
jgi:hypothetical protein